MNKKTSESKLGLGSERGRDKGAVKDEKPQKNKSPDRKDER